MTVCVLGSGSKGNAIYVSDGETSVLIDAGFSGKEIVRRMGERKLSPDKLTAVLVSHEHADHIKGVGVMARRFGIPVCAGEKTLEYASVGKLPVIHHFEGGTSFSIGTLTIHPFSISHDASDPSFFTIQRNQTKVGIATDLGIATAMVKEHLKGCGLLVLEANHDPKMLMEGPYPWPLKQRVKGRSGHLSNQDTRELLGELGHDGLRHVVLAHLSEVNNRPEIARRVVGEAACRHKMKLSVAMQGSATELIKI